jgi:hypothetical protein
MSKVETHLPCIELAALRGRRGGSFFFCEDFLLGAGGAAFRNRSRKPTAASVNPTAATPATTPVDTGTLSLEVAGADLEGRLRSTYSSSLE